MHVVRSTGKEDRLIGDSRASGASPAAKFSERAELPSLYIPFWSCYRGGSRHSDWSLFSLDIKGAHKSIRTAPEDTGFSVFQFQGQYYVYLVNHFGAAWSAYWWSRLGALLMRLAHHLLRHKHLGGVYVDDFLFFLPRQCAAAMAAQLIALFQILGVPLSWKKLRLGFSLAFLGWHVSVSEGCFACVTAEKQVKLDQEMQIFLTNPRKVSRQGLMKVLGLLIWATQARLTLRSFLAPLYRAAHSRSQKLACLSLEQVEELLPLLNGDLEVVSSPEKGDVQKGWRLAGVGARGCRDLGMVQRLLKQPKLRNGKIWLRFLAWGSTVKLPPAAVAALKVLRQQLLGQRFSLMQPTSLPNGAADAWACAHLAGLGGWFEAEGKLYWFHLELKAQDMPEDWGWPDVMQKAIGALELLGQLALVILRCRLGAATIGQVLNIRQQCDNMGAVGSVAKGLCTHFPLGAALITLATVCIGSNVDLHLSHLAGERNVEADALSRLNCAERPAILDDWTFQHRFGAQNRLHLSVEELLRPWKVFLST